MASGRRQPATSEATLVVPISERLRVSCARLSKTTGQNMSDNDSLDDMLEYQDQAEKASTRMLALFKTALA